MKPHNRTVGLAAAASVALMLATAACGDSKSSILTPSPGLNPEPAPVATFTVSGTISEATESGAAPIEGATVASADTENWVVTDADGFYRLSGLRAGMARLVVSKEGYEERVVEMMIDSDAQLDAQLIRQG
jgi:hypothetical protein